MRVAGAGRPSKPILRSESGVPSLARVRRCSPAAVRHVGGGLLNRPAGLVIVYLGFLVPFTTWLLKTGFDQVPRQLDDAARVDGLSAFGIMIRIAVPIARASIATTVLFALLMAWDEFFYALLFTSNASAKTVTVAIVDFTSGRVSDYGLVAVAGVVAAVLPVAIGFPAAAALDLWFDGRRRQGLSRARAVRARRAWLDCRCCQPRRFFDRYLVSGRRSGFRAMR